MEPIRLNGRDRTLIAISTVIFIVSLAVGLLWFGDAMPEASIDFQVNRSQSSQIAGDYLDQLGVELPDSLRHAAIFSWDNQAKTYLEKELGLEKVQGILDDPVHLWSWRHRWFSPGNKEEYRVFVSPDGKVISMRHLEDEDAPGDSLEREDAFDRALAFLTGTMGIDTSTVQFHEGSQQNRPHRRDWTFVWKLKDFEPLPGSDYRYTVLLHGDAIAGHSETLHVPESWQSGYRRLRSYNQLANSVASFLLFATIVAMIVIFVQKLRTKEIQWKTALWFGGVATVLVYANNLNGLPNTLYSYDTTTSWSGFLVQSIFLGLLSSLAVGLLIALVTASAEAMFRERHPELPSLPAMFTPRGLRTKKAFLNVVVGIAMTAFFFAYQTVFYLVADKFGGWSPADVPYDNLLNTTMPWLAVLMIGFLPAVSEEFISRLFSIPFLEKLFKGRVLWLAVVIPAFIWGFGHAGYPNQPFWIRGVEVGMAGVIIGFLFLRFGILAPLLWHYTVDAFYTGFLLFGSDNLYFVITAVVGAGLVLVPLVATLVAYLRTGTFLPDSGTLNRDIKGESFALLDIEEGESAEVVAEETTSTSDEKFPAPLPRPIRLAALLLLAAGLLITPRIQIGDFIEFDTNGKQALSTFSDTLASLGWADTDTLETYATFGGGGGSSSGPEAYTLKHVASLEEFNSRFDTLHGVGRWTVMAWQPENRLRFWGLVNGRNGQIVRLEAMLPEEMAGDTLSDEQARTLADSALAAAGVNLAPLVLAESRSNSRPSRVDHTLVYETKEGDPRNLGEAKLRWTVQVDGSYVSLGVHPTLKVPEAWSREREASTGLRTTHRIIVVLLRAFAIGYLMVLLLGQSRRGAVNWKRSLLWALVPTLLYLTALPSQLIDLKGIYFWQTDIPWSVFLGSGALSLVLVSAAIYLFFALLLASASALWDDRVAELGRPADSGLPLDGLLAALGGLGLFALGATLNGFLDEALPQSIVFGGWNISSALGGFLPAASLLASSVTRMAMTAGSLMILAMLWQRVFRTTPMRILFVILVLFAGQNVSAIGMGEWFHSLLATVIRFGVAGAVLVLFVQGSAIRLVAISWLVALVPALYDAWSVMPSAWGQMLVAAIAGFGLLGYWLSRGGKPSLS